MKKMLIHPGEAMAEKVAEVEGAVAKLLSEGKAVSIVLIANDEMLSPQQAGEVLGFSRQHTRRLIDAGELEGTQIPGSEHWKVPATAVLAFEERRKAATADADSFSHELDELGAPLE